MNTLLAKKPPAIALISVLAYLALGSLLLLLHALSRPLGFGVTTALAGALVGLGFAYLGLPVRGLLRTPGWGTVNRRWRRTGSLHMLCGGGLAAIGGSLSTGGLFGMALPDLPPADGNPALRVLILAGLGVFFGLGMAAMGLWFDRGLDRGGPLGYGWALTVLGLWEVPAVALSILTGGALFLSAAIGGRALGGFLLTDLNTQPLRSLGLGLGVGWITLLPLTAYLSGLG